MNAVSFVLIPCVSRVQLGRRRSLAAILAMCASSPQRAAHAQTVCSRPPRLALPGCIYVFNGQVTSRIGFHFLALPPHELLPPEQFRFAIVM